jgi:hypothetical protein
MTRRVRLPRDELFRTTTNGAVLRSASAASTAPVTPPHAEERPHVVGSAEDRAANSSLRRGTGRQRHDEKITVYVSPEELLDLEKVRIMLRAEYGLVVDRGRIVREAIALLLGDLDANEADSALVTRLRDR